MDKVICKNVFISENEKEINKSFNMIWQKIVNLLVNNIKE